MRKEHWFNVGGFFILQGVGGGAVRWVFMGSISTDFILRIYRARPEFPRMLSRRFGKFRLEIFGDGVHGWW